MESTKAIKTIPVRSKAQRLLPCVLHEIFHQPISLCPSGNCMYSSSSMLFVCNCCAQYITKIYNVKSFSNFYLSQRLHNFSISSVKRRISLLAPSLYFLTIARSCCAASNSFRYTSLIRPSLG